MNIQNYLESRSFEDFEDAPVGTADLAHNTGGEAPVVAEGTTVEQTNSLEIPESAGPAVVASSDEVQAAAIVEDPGHSEAEQMANAASDANAAVIDQAQVAPGQEPAVGEAPAAPVEEGGGDEGLPASDGLDAGGDVGAGTGDELGDVSATDGDDLGDGGETADLGETSGDDGLGETAGDEALGDLGESEAGVDDAPVVEEEETAGEEDGLGDTLGGETETGSEEETGAEEESTGETETGDEGGEEAGGSEEETSGEEEGSEEGGEAGEEESGSADDVDSDDGIDYDIPDVDTETDDETVEEAKDEAAEAVAEEEELDEEIVDTSKSVKELDEEDVAVEEFIGVLSHGIRTQKFNPQTVALAQAKLLKLSAKFGVHAPVIPSMEDYTKDNLGAYYTNSLESFSGFLKKIRHARKNFFDRFAQKMNEKIHLKAVETEIAALNKALDQQIVRVKGLELASPVSIAVPGPVRSSSGVLKGMTAELQWLNAVAPVFKIDQTYLESIGGILKKAIAEGDYSKATDNANKALKLAMPVKKYPAECFTGSPNVEMKFVKSEAKATGSMADDMKSLAYRAIPQIESSIKPHGTGEKKAEFKKTDLVKILQLCKVLIGLSRGTAGSVGKGLVDQLNVANTSSTSKDMGDKKTGDADAQRRGEAALNQLASQFWTGLTLSLENYSGFQWRIVHIVDGLLQIVQRAK